VLEFDQFLMWLQGEGISIVMGVVMPFLLESWPWFGKFTKPIKRLVSLGFFLIVPVVGALVSAAFSYQPWNFVQTFWPALQAGFLAFWASQAIYLLANKKK